MYLEPFLGGDPSLKVVNMINGIPQDPPDH